MELVLPNEKTITKCSIGVKVIAVLSLVGSALVLLIAIMFGVLMFFVPLTPGQEVPFPPSFLKLMLVFGLLIYVLPAIWGIFTGIGLLRLRNWARISIIVFSVLLILMGGFAALSTILVSVVVPSRTVDPAVASSIRLSLAALWLSLLSIGAWWLVFFTRRGVQQQFTFTHSTPPPAAPGILAAQAPAVLLPAIPQRPISLTIVAWFLLIGCLCIPLAALLHSPAIFLTRVLTGWPALLLYVLFAALSFYIGFGLLRYKPFAREIGVGYFVFTFVNSAIFYFAPGGRLRMQALLDMQESIFPWMKSSQAGPQFQFNMTPMLFVGGICGLLATAVPIYFLITRKRAFEEAAQFARGG